MTLAAWLHNLNPILLELGPVAIRWYGLSYLAGFFVAYLMVKRVCSVGVSTLKPENAADLVVAVAIGIFIGGRLGYVLLYSPDLIWEFSGSIPFWGVLAINKGGMASHGGMIGGMIGCLYFARRNKHDFLYLCDLFAFTAPLGIFFGRIANFINGELLGRPCSPDFPLAVKFPQELVDLPYEQLYSIYDRLPPPGSIVPDLTSWNEQVIIELIQNGNTVISSAIEPFLTPRHPSQLYAGTMEGLVVLAVLMLIWMKPRKPGLIAGSFAMVYAVMRIINEFFRMPDAHIIDKEFATLHITRGQWLSALLFLFGIALATIALKRKSNPMGGWRSRKDESATDKHG